MTTKLFRIPGRDHGAYSDTFGRRQKRLLTMAVFMAAVVAALIFQILVPAGRRMNESSDYTGFYEPVARQIAAGNGVVLPDGTPALLYPPGYPLVLGALIAGARGARLAEGLVLSVFRLLTHGIAAALLFIIASRAWGVARSVVTGLAWSTYPLALWLTKQPNSEAPFLVVYYLAVLLFLSLLSTPKGPWRKSLGLGILLGISMLIRPIALGLGIVMATLIAVRYVRRNHAGRGLLLALAVLAGNLLVILPWEAWVHARTGNWILLQSGSLQPIRDGLVFAARPGRAANDIAALSRDIEARLDPRVRSRAEVARVLLFELRDSPIQLIKLFLLKAARGWYGTDSGRNESAVLILQIPYLILTVWSAAIALNGNQRFVLLVCGLSLYFWAMTVMAFSMVRYMVPSIGLLFTLFPALLPSSPPVWRGKMAPLEDSEG